MNLNSFSFPFKFTSLMPRQKGKSRNVTDAYQMQYHQGTEPNTVKCLGKKKIKIKRNPRSDRLDASRLPCPPKRTLGSPHPGQEPFDFYSSTLFLRGREISGPPTWSSNTPPSRRKIMMCCLCLCTCVRACVVGRQQQGMPPHHRPWTSI